jgi:hypothetical protein
MPPDTETSLHAQRLRDPEGFAREIEALREALRQHLETHSLRQVSREIGMSPTGVSNFVNGSEPYVPTIRKLRAWRAAHPAASAEEDG